MKLRYEIDPHNRLIVQESQKKAKVSRFRHVIEGKFKIGAGNTLVYHIKAPSYGVTKRLNLPHQVKLRGNWSLTKEHNLMLTLNKWRRQRIGDELTLTGRIIKVDARSLLFSVTQRTKENFTSIYILKLEGQWQADRNNRITFRIKKEKSSYDALLFDGIWRVNHSHQLVYHYEEKLAKRRKRRKRRKHSLLFDGSWNYAKKDGLTYRLGLQDRPAFDFRIGHVIALKNAIRFEVGIGTSQRKRPVKKDIILYGKWKVKKGAGLIFEMRCGGGRVREMVFESDVKMIDNSRIKFTLRNKRGEDLGVTLTLSKKLLKGCGESFIRLLRSKKEKAVYLGSGFMW